MESLIIQRLSALSHEQRMRIFRLLVRRYPDALPAGEIAGTLSLKPSTASAYLTALMRVGLIRQTRRGTSLLYGLDLDAARAVVDGLFFDCCLGRPDLCPSDLIDPLARLAPERSYNVLFICTGNSARSIFAEAILNAMPGDRFRAHSAGTHPYDAPNPVALRMLAQKGFDVSGLRSKDLVEFQSADAPKMDFVFTVCDRSANEDCPPWSGQPITAHWGLADPVRATGTDAEMTLAFQQAYGILHNRLTGFSALPLEALDRLTIQKKVDALGQSQEIS